MLEPIEDSNKNDSYSSIPLNATLSLAALVIIIGGMKAGASLIVPLLLAFFIAVVCTSPVQWLHRRGLPMRLSVFLSLLVLIGVVSLLGLLVVNSFSTFVDSLPDIEARLYDAYRSMLDTLSSLGLAIDPVKLNELFDVESGTTWVPTVLGQIGNLFMQSIVVWGWVFGAAGMLLSVLLTMTLKIALDSHPQTRWMAHLLGPGVRLKNTGSKPLRDARKPPIKREG